MASELASHIISMIVSTTSAQPAPAVRSPVTDKVSVRQAPAPSGSALPSQAHAKVASQIQPQPQPRPPALQDTVSQLNAFAQSIDRQLQFSIDRQSGLVVIKVVDTQTHQVIRQIPAKDVLALARQMHEARKGALFAQKV